MHEFIKRKRGVTHYIYKIQLGAFRYFQCESNKAEASVGGRADVPVEGADLEAQAEYLKVDISSKVRIQTCGNVEAVKPFFEDGAIEMTIRPVYTLLHRKKASKFLKEAVVSYTSK